jgi:hypothetical protein
MEECFPHGIAALDLVYKKHLGVECNGNLVYNRSRNLDKKDYNVS